MDEKVTKWWHEADDKDPRPSSSTTEPVACMWTWPRGLTARGLQPHRQRLSDGVLVCGGRSTFNLGPAIFDWQVGNIVSVARDGHQPSASMDDELLGIGDPVYALGKVQPRPSADLAAEGLDGSVPCSTS